MQCGISMNVNEVSQLYFKHKDFKNNETDKKTLSDVKDRSKSSMLANSNSLFSSALSTSD
jgi:hypothetical protein